MPRGARARHGASVEGAVHSHSGVADGTMISAEFAWLPATCWCETHMVGVPQREIKDIRTRSCGLDGCTGPDGDTELGLVVTHSGNVLDQVVEFTRAAPIRNGGPVSVNQGDHRFRSRAYVAPDTLRRLHNDTETGERLYQRRQVVAHMWFDQKSPREIARYLGVTYQTAINDIHWLRKRHLI